MTDYNNSVIYKLYCKDDNIDDFYIGSSKNIKNRKRSHKSRCKTKNKQLKLYNFINNNGGYNNFDYEILEKVNCNNKLDLLKKERHYIELLKPSLNIKIPSMDRKERRKIYKQQNKDKIKEKKKEYYENNKDKINEKRKIKIKCVCGCIICKYSIPYHMKTKKHMILIKNKKIDFYIHKEI